MDPLKTSPSIVDDDIIRAIKSGGPAGDKAIMTLYARYHAYIRSFIHSLRSRHPDHASVSDDIVHDSFIIMLHKIRNETPVLTSIRAYWSGIAKNLWLNQLKKSKKVFLAEESEVRYGHNEHTPESIFLDKERYRRIEHCLCKCGGRCHEILLLWLSDYTMQEIADRLNLSGPAMARKIKHECFKKLKKMVTNRNIFTS